MFILNLLEPGTDNASRLYSERGYGQQLINSEERHGMSVKNILSRVKKQGFFVYGVIDLQEVGGEPALEGGLSIPACGGACFMGDAVIRRAKRSIVARERLTPPTRSSPANTARGAMGQRGLDVLRLRRLRFGTDRGASTL